MRVGFKVKIYPNETQKQILSQHIGACRYVYNHFLALKKETYLTTGKSLTHSIMSRELTKMRREIDWMSKVQFQPMQQSLRSLDVAYNRFFRKQADFPNFHKKNGKQTMRKVMGWSIEGNKINIMNGVSVRFRGTFPEKRYGTLTITRDSCGDWWASTFGEKAMEKPKLSGAIGIDVGLKHIAITSDGEKYDNPHVFRGLLGHIQTASKALSRTQKGSRTRAKRLLTLSRVHRRVGAMRKNHLHHVSKAIVGKNHAMIAVEDLNVKGMMQNRKLSRAIADTGWGELIRQLEYKQERKGGKLLRIDRFFPSSKMCSECNFVLDTLSLSVREWKCPSCGITHDRDINAAKTILKQAGEQLGLEGGENNSRKRVKVTRPVKV